MDRETATVGLWCVCWNRGRGVGFFLFQNVLTRKCEENGHCYRQNPNREKPAMDRTAFFTYGTISEVMESFCWSQIRGKERPRN